MTSQFSDRQLQISNKRDYGCSEFFFSVIIFQNRVFSSNLYIFAQQFFDSPIFTGGTIAINYCIAHSKYCLLYTSDAADE